MKKTLASREKPVIGRQWEERVKLVSPSIQFARFEPNPALLPPEAAEA